MSLGVANNKKTKEKHKKGKDNVFGVGTIFSINIWSLYQLQHHRNGFYVMFYKNGNWHLKY